MTHTINWQPEAKLQAKINQIALKLGQSPETIISQAVAQYLESMEQKTAHKAPLIGLFNGSPKLAIESEDILYEDIDSNSGWTWKK